MNGFEPINIANYAIILSAFATIFSLMLNLDLWVKRICMAIRNQDLTYTHSWGAFSTFAALLIASILVRIML